MTRYDIDSMREIDKELRSSDLTVDNCTVGFRTYSIITKLKILENEIEMFLTCILNFAQKLGVNQNIMRKILIKSSNMTIQVPILKYQLILLNNLRKFNICTRVGRRNSKFK
jgi:hypothetical protein